MRFLIKCGIFLCAMVAAATIVSYSYFTLYLDDLYANIPGPPVAISFLFVSPLLFFLYFPWSIWAWNNNKRMWPIFLMAGITAGLLDGLYVYFQTMNDGVLRSSQDNLAAWAAAAIMGFLTALFHWIMLTALEKHKSEWLR